MEYRYWDSNCFLKWLKKEGGYESCRGVIDCAEKGELQIVTSALTIAEVIYLKPHEKIDRQKSNDICRFFEQDYILIINVDRVIAEMARNLLWDHQALRPKDAIHVASAVKAEIPILDTFDDYLIKLSGIIGDPPLVICKPNIPYQEQIVEAQDEEENADDE